MKHISQGRVRNAARRGGALLALALPLPALAWSAGALALASLTLSPTEVTVGEPSTGTVTLDAAPTKTVTVKLTSGIPAIATVPPSVSFSSRLRTRTRTFQVTSVGLGCSEITASLGGVTRTALFTVQPPPPASSLLKLDFSSNPTVSGGTITGTVTLVASPGAYTVQLSSSDAGAARVPTSVSIRVAEVEGISGIGTASFPITTAVGSPRPVCPIITASGNGRVVRALLQLFPLGG